MGFSQLAYILHLIVLSSLGIKGAMLAASSSCSNTEYNMKVSERQNSFIKSSDFNGTKCYKVKCQCKLIFKRNNLIIDSKIEYLKLIKLVLTKMVFFSIELKFIRKQEILIQKIATKSRRLIHTFVSHLEWGWKLLQSFLQISFQELNIIYFLINILIRPV